MPGVLWGFGDVAEIDQPGLCPQGASSLMGRTDRGGAVTGRGVIEGRLMLALASRKDPLSWDSGLGYGGGLVQNRMGSPRAPGGVWCTFSLLVVQPGSCRKPGVSGVEEKGRNGIVFWAFVFSNTRSPGASCAFFFQTDSFQEELIN